MEPRNLTSRRSVIRCAIRSSRSPAAIGLVVASLVIGAVASAGDEIDSFEITKRSRVETSPGSGRFHVVFKRETLKGKQTAVIVCDMWDAHHCLNAVRRVKEMAPRMNRFLHTARDRGALVIHAPSSCMKPYEGHPGRERAKRAPRAKNLPEDIGSWCHRIPAEEKGKYPIDQSDGGEDDDPEEHRRWHEELSAKGLNPRAPWTRQIDMLDIRDEDVISDSGVEIWNVLEERDISNVFLVGVHTNMCVLGRPFGLRQMAKNGKNVVLVRDQTDTMYNPARWPYVSHFTGTDLIVEHIEKYVCPTVTSDQVLGGRPFRFSKDDRPHIAFVIAEDEYETQETLPAFARDHLGGHFRTSFIFGSDTRRNDIPGLEALDDADILFLSVRRRALPEKQLARIRRFVDSGKPLVALRTSSHAFALRGKPPQAEHALWPEFDSEVLGGSYHGHHGSKKNTFARVLPDAAGHPIVASISPNEHRVSSSLYKTSPVAKDATLLMMGRVEGSDRPEPVAWTRTRRGGRVFYTSLGHRGDFEQEWFRRLLWNALFWAVDRDAPALTTARAE